MDHLKRVEEEFTRQAETFDAYAAKAGGDVIARFQAAIGAAAEGRILDVACGPGVVTAALAERAETVTAFDATPAMLEQARKRCEEAGLRNVIFEHGVAESLPFEPGAFDGVVTRLALHHFVDPNPVLAEMFRVLRPGGVAVIADVVVSEDAAKAKLQNAIEIIRDPSHIRMLPLTELKASIEGSGLDTVFESVWDASREFEEWMGIANDPQRVGPLRTIARTLAEDGRDAGMGLSIRDDKLVFFHRWVMIAARKPE
jgi:ubiquinone/menaquinone biosynthesis C-methylase UbiE